MTRVAALVIGTPRSGTSVTAGVLHRLGVHMGDDLLPATEMNPLGFYQCVEFESLFDGIPEWVPDYPGGIPDDVRAGVRRVAASRCESGGPWGAKFKLAAWVVGDVAAVCRAAGYDLRLVVTSRPVSESVASLAHWTEPGDQDPAEVIDRAGRAVGAALADSGLPTHTVKFGDLLTNPTGEVVRLATFLGTGVTPEAVTFVTPAVSKFAADGCT